MVAQPASEQEKLLPLLPLANDKHWEGKGIHDVDQQPVCCWKARWHKQCVERACIVVVDVVVVVVGVFGWGANEWNGGGNEFHQWPW